MLTVLHFNKNDEKTKLFLFRYFVGKIFLHDQYITRVHRHALPANDVSERKDPAMNVIYHDILKHIFRWLYSPLQRLMHIMSKIAWYEYSCKHIHNIQYMTYLYMLHTLLHCGVHFWPDSAASEIRELDLQSRFWTILGWCMLIKAR